MDNWLMYNWFQIETESQHRRLEWDRAVAADARAASADAERATPRPLPPLHHSLFRMKLSGWLCRVKLVTSVASCRSSSKSFSAVQPYRVS